MAPSPDEPTDDARLPIVGAGVDPPAPYRGPPALVAVVGLALLAVAVWNFDRELRTLDGVVVPPVVAFLTGVVLATAVLYGAYLLYESDLGPAGRWLTAAFCVVGAGLFSGVIALTIVVRYLEGRPVGEEVFVLFSAAGSGGVAGLLVGGLYARVRRDAASARRARDRFAFLNSTLRHDVLNNMMIIRARADHIRGETGGQTAEFADTIVERSDGVVEFIERVRSLLTTLSGDGEREAYEMSLTAAVEGRMAAVRDTFDAVEFEADVSRDVTVLADDLLEDVVGNLLRNAVEHNDADTPRVRVAVEAETGSSVARLRIADNGPGVPDDLKDAVFRRGQTGLHEDGTGSGFGLFFVDAMVSQYGGRVWIEDNEPRGSVFVVELPRA